MCRGVCSDRGDELIERGRDTSTLVSGCDAELVAPTSQVLDEAMARDRRRRGPTGSQTAHGSEPDLESAVASLDAVVRVRRRVVRHL